MKFRTEIEVKPFDQKIDHSHNIFSIGSCFAEEMASTLHEGNFNVESNPTGVLFNPASIHSALHHFAECKSITNSDLHHANDTWFSYDFHSQFNGCDSDDVQRNINRAIERGHKSLTAADWVVITFGTAWVYTLNESGAIVANCQKQPASNFTRRRLAIEEIVAMYEELMHGILADKQVIFTVSPVRHLGDGADENFLSKSILKVAVAEIVERFDNAHYFPAYEILCDDLRDYRFYDTDLVHPSIEAVWYIREKFFDAVLSKQALALLPQIEKIEQACRHRAFNKDSSAYLDFCHKQLEKIAALPQVNFESEQWYFESEIDLWHQRQKNADDSE